MDSNVFNYIDFFSGCGGLSLGLGSAGWNGIFAIEINPIAFQTFKHNLIDDASIRHHFDSWPEWLSKEADKRNLSLSKILQEALMQKVSI